MQWFANKSKPGVVVTKVLESDEEDADPKKDKRKARRKTQKHKTTKPKMPKLIDVFGQQARKPRKRSIFLAYLDLYWKKGLGDDVT